MDLQQAKMQLADLRENQLSFVCEEEKNNKDNEFIKDADAITKILTTLDNSVSKDAIRKIIENLNVEWEKEIETSGIMTNMRRFQLASQCDILSKLLNEGKQ